MSKTKAPIKSIKVKYAGLYALCLGWLMITGCASTGSFLDVSTVNKLHAGMSRKEVQEIFGKPKHSERGSNQKTLDLYDEGFNQSAFSRGVAQVVSGEIESRTLSILYGSDEKLELFRHYVSQTGYQEEKPGVIRVGKMITTAETSRIIKGKTSKQEFVAWAGEPTQLSLLVDGSIECHWGYFEIRAAQVINRQFFEILCNKDEVILDYRFVDK